MKSTTHLARTRIRIAPQAYPRAEPLVLALLSMEPWSAAPVLAVEGGQIVQGQGDVRINGPTTTINQQSDAMIRSWANFNIAPNQRVQFLQPSSSAFALNRVLSSDPTAIFGQLLANGQIVLINPNGITFGAGAQVNVGALVASTLEISDADFLRGASSGQFTFSGASSGRIVNHGAINAGQGGYVALMAKQVSNRGLLNAPQGTVALAAGERVSLSHAGRLLNVSVEAATLDALVENKQAIRADGGQVILSAKAERALLNTVVNQSGIIKARGIENKNGRIFLSGGSSGVVNVAGTLDASGKNSGERGGEVTITGENIALNKGASIDASGAVAGGTVLVGGDYQGGGDTPHAHALWMDSAASIAANATQDGAGGKVILGSDEATRAYGNNSATGNQAGGLVETSGQYLDVTGITLTSATIASNNGNIVLAGDPSGTGFSSNKTGSGIILNAATLDAGNGAITLRGEGRGAANTSGVALSNSSVVKSSGATISITGKNADVSALANQTGVSIATNSFVIGAAANNISIIGNSGAGNGTGNAGVIVQSGARIGVTNGALNLTGTSIGTGDQAIGVLVSGANSRIDSVGNGAMTIIGQGSSAVGATNAAGVSIANSGSLLAKDGATSLVGVGGTNSGGVQINNATVGANGLGSFTIVAQGDGIAAGLTTSGLQPILLSDQGGALILEPSNGGGTVTQASTISANALALNGAAGDFTLNHAGNAVATVAGNAGRIAYRQSGSLAIGTVTGADASVTIGILVSDQVTLQTTDLLANLTLNSAVVAQGAGFAAVLSTQRDVINNVGASALQTPNGNWALYANNPVTSVFNGLSAPTNVFGNSIATLPPTSLPAGANAIVFQSLKPPVPPIGGDPPPQNPPAADFSGAGSQMLELDAADGLFADLPDDVRGDDFLEAWQTRAYIPLEVVYGGMKLPSGLMLQEVELEKLRRRLGISGDPGHRYYWWR